ncbi:MAG: phage tail sheath subtilisin-like domain-containing protein [Clostridiales bacterium]|nr:phage tail sheath subtilisin-like domain-containing protein [Clostridiales bacterium]
MGGIFKVGETKIRPGIYNRITQKKNDTEKFLDGVGACVFRADFGPVNQIMEFTPNSDYKKMFGTSGTTDIIDYLFQGGANSVIACRIGKEGTAATITLKNTELEEGQDVVKITAKYSGSREFAVTIRNRLTQEDRECIIYSGTEEIETFQFEKNGDEAAALVSAMENSKYFKAEKMNTGGTLADVAQKAFTLGTEMSVTAAEYQKGFEQLELELFNTFCVDTEELEILTLAKEFMDRIFSAGQFTQLVIAEKTSVDLEQRMEHAESFNSRATSYVLNSKLSNADGEMEGYQTAAQIAGMLAAYPSSTSLTHKIIDGAVEMKEPLTPTIMEEAEKRGCLVLSYSANKEVWIDNSINTLVKCGEDEDEGWKKNRRIKTRYELMRRMNAKTDELIGDIDNDPNGRATIMGRLQDVANAMILEGKITSCNIAESTEYVANGDSAWFSIGVIDKDSAERIYLTYEYQFNTNEE